MATIWGAVVLISVLSPDMVSGSEHQHLPIAAFASWLWGIGATVVSTVSLARLRGDVGRRPFWLLLSGTTVVIWTIATVVSIFGPTLETGTDPTIIPLAALIAPPAMMATGLASVIVLVVERLDRGGSAPTR